MFTESLSATLDRAVAIAGTRPVTCDHLLAALADDEDAGPALEACGVPVHELKERMSGIFEDCARPLTAPSQPAYDWQAGSALEGAKQVGLFSGAATGITLLLELFAHRNDAYTRLQEFDLHPENIANYAATLQTVAVSSLSL